MHWVVMSQDVVMQDAWRVPRVDTERYYHSAAPVASFRALPRAVEPRQDLCRGGTFQAPAPNRWVQPQAVPAWVQENYHPPAPIQPAASGVHRYSFNDVPYRPRRKSVCELAVQKFKQVLPPLTAVAALLVWAAALLSSENPQTWLPW